MSFVCDGNKNAPKFAKKHKMVLVGAKLVEPTCASKLVGISATKTKTILKTVLVFGFLQNVWTRTDFFRKPKQKKIGFGFRAWAASASKSP